MPLLKLEQAQLSYGLQVLLDNVQLSFYRGQRLCIIGRNGAGKSSLMKVIAKEVELDSGAVWHKPSVKIARLEQDLPMADDINVYDAVASGLEKAGELLSEFHRLIECSDEKSLEKLGDVQTQIDAIDGWSLQQRVETTLTKLNLPAGALMKELSGGWRRRVSLARALVSEPDVLLLDEPTNHLDIEAIQWLEQQLLNYQGCVIFITHDRSLLRSLATHIAELDRGHIQVWEGNYDSFLEFREQQLADEARHNALFDKRLAEEETWIRQGIKARRTRNEGRVRALKAMRNERMARREKQGSANFQGNVVERSGKLVAELKNVSHGWGSKQLIKGFTGTIIRGDRIGLIGANGMGKTTLLKILLGELSPDSGTVELGTNLQVAYFDQLRDQLDLDKNAVDNVGGGRESVEINGQNRHIISYLSDFLFTGERARTPLRALSGGERNRVLLARLFSKPANLMVLDEPTNDLDVETLELLEEMLGQFTGTLLLVSHDRAFLDNVVTSTLAFEGDGQILDYVGGYNDWIKQGGKWVSLAQDLNASANLTALNEPAEKAPVPKVESTPKIKKLSYKHQRELEQLPAQIDAAEKAILAHQEVMQADGFYQQDRDVVAKAGEKLSSLESELEVLFERWDELENL